MKPTDLNLCDKIESGIDFCKGEENLQECRASDDSIVRNKLDEE